MSLRTVAYRAAETEVRSSTAWTHASGQDRARGRGAEPVPVGVSASRSALLLTATQYGLRIDGGTPLGVVFAPLGGTGSPVFVGRGSLSVAGGWGAARGSASSSGGATGSSGCTS